MAGNDNELDYRDARNLLRGRQGKDYLILMDLFLAESPCPGS
jgi:hypothetical protein